MPWEKKETIYCFINTKQAYTVKRKKMVVQDVCRSKMLLNFTAAERDVSQVNVPLASTEGSKSA